MKRYFRFFILAAVLCGCIHSAPLPDEVKSSAPGFGSSTLRPSGSPLVFPAGIKVVGKPHWEMECINEALKEKKVYGNGGAVRFCIQFSNSTNRPVTVVIPAGTVFISESTESQNGLVIQTIAVTVPPSSAPFFYFLNNCINQERDITNYMDTFETTPIVTDHEGVHELTDLLANKQVNAEDYESQVPPSEISVPVQIAVHEIAHTGNMSASSRAALAKLPEK